MVYAVEDVARTLKQAREAKGLSQRALSAKVGLTQAHISNIENAAADLHLSNLMELARALDLEVMLVPRRAVPAVQGLVRNIENTAQVQTQPSKTVRHLERSFEKLAALYPQSTEIPKLRNLVAVFRKFHLNKDQVHTVDSAAKELRRVTDTLQKSKVRDLAGSPAEAQRIGRITNQLRQLQNTIVHAMPPENLNRIQPAYRLDDGGADG